MVFFLAVFLSLSSLSVYAQSSRQTDHSARLNFGSNTGRIYPPQAASKYKRVEIKLRVFIPSQAVNFKLDAGNSDYMYGGDDRDFDYQKTGSRFDMTAVVTTDPKQRPEISKHTNPKITTTRYVETDGAHVKGKPHWWWSVKPEAIRQACNSERLPTGIPKDCKTQDVPNTMEVSAGNGVVKVSITIPGIGNPFPTNVGIPYPAPDGKFTIFIKQCGDNILYYYRSWHNKFPAYELYIEQQRVYEYMPIGQANPLGMLGWPGFSEFSSTNWKKLGKSSEPASSNPEATCEPATIFLFDTSGSMQENDKIGQSRASALYSLNSIKSRAGNGGITPPISILSFSGACSPASTRQLLPFTDDLRQAESTIRSGLPMPGGETPLPQARQAAQELLSEYLENNPIPDGRVILLSDGLSTCGAVRPAGSYGFARSGKSSKTGNQSSGAGSSQIRYLTIGFDVPPGSPAERDLQYLASSSKGKYFNAPDQRQLTRVFERFIQTYNPKRLITESKEDEKWSSDFAEGVEAIGNRDYELAKQKFQRVISIAPGNSASLYNLALALEANDRYKGAVEYYRLYLQNNPQAADKVIVEQKITELRRDYQDQFEYYLKIIESDMAYLKKYYASLFNKSNDALAAEFAGFVAEKGEFYTNLPDILEVKAKWLESSSKDLSSSLYDLSDLIGKPDFDRSAVSLLTVSIAYLEDDILKPLTKDKAKFITY